MEKSQHEIRESLKSMVDTISDYSQAINKLLQQKTEITSKQISYLYGFAEAIATEQRILERETQPKFAWAQVK